MQILFIFTGLCLLIAALVRLVFDGLVIYESAIIGFELLSQSWQKYFPAGFKLIEKHMPMAVWDPYLVWILQQPSFAILGAFGLLFILSSFMFRRRNKRKLADEFL